MLLSAALAALALAAAAISTAAKEVDRPQVVLFGVGDDDFFHADIFFV